MGNRRYKTIELNGKYNIIKRIRKERDKEIEYREILLEKPIYFTKRGVYRFKLRDGEEIIGLLTESCGRIIEDI